VTDDDTETAAPFVAFEACLARIGHRMGVIADHSVGTAHHDVSPLDATACIGQDTNVRECLIGHKM
jgi:hypothetical protein